MYVPQVTLGELFTDLLVSKATAKVFVTSDADIVLRGYKAKNLKHVVLEPNSLDFRSEINALAKQWTQSAQDLPTIIVLNGHRIAIGEKYDVITKLNGAPLVFIQAYITADDGKVFNVSNVPNANVANGIPKLSIYSVLPDSNFIASYLTGNIQIALYRALRLAFNDSVTLVRQSYFHFLLALLLTRFALTRTCSLSEQMKLKRKSKQFQVYKC